MSRGLESFYGSPLDVSLTKSLVLKPGHGHTSRNTVPLATPTSSVRSPSQNKKICQHVFFIAPFLVSTSNETLVKKIYIAGFGGGYRRISHRCSQKGTLQTNKYLTRLQAGWHRRFLLFFGRS